MSTASSTLPSLIHVIKSSTSHSAATCLSFSTSLYPEVLCESGKSTLHKRPTLSWHYKSFDLNVGMYSWRVPTLYLALAQLDATWSCYSR